MEASLISEHESLTAMDYNRTKKGLGFSGSEPNQPSHDVGAASVAAHYNALGDRHRTLSSGSNILQTRNLNNWIKSVLIGQYLAPSHSVLDLACGKGGDLLKFKAGRCGCYVGVDIALQSVCDAVTRYNGSNGRAPNTFRPNVASPPHTSTALTYPPDPPKNPRLALLILASTIVLNRRSPMPFPATFCAGDFSTARLDASLPSEIRFNLVSCQALGRRVFMPECHWEHVIAGGMEVAHVSMDGDWYKCDQSVICRRLWVCREPAYVAHFRGVWRDLQLSICT